MAQVNLEIVSVVQKENGAGEKANLRMQEWLAAPDAAAVMKHSGEERNLIRFEERRIQNDLSIPSLPAARPCAFRAFPAG